MNAAVLVMAKAPVPGQVKTRLAAVVGDHVAAGLATAALLDTLDACEAAFGRDRCHLALAGDLTRAARGVDLAARLERWSVFTQRGSSFGHRLANAHVTAGRVSGRPVVQIGMDTPQVTPALLEEVAAALSDPSVDAVLGPALDGGWWVLGSTDPAWAAVLAGVPMSTVHTGRDTEAALARAGARVRRAAPLRDVDTVADASVVARQVPRSHFARAWACAPSAARRDMSDGPCGGV